ncbi:hypothetical protein [Brucella pseudintermedia]|uniref:hypothetical protein n=1 Tax=Brucella pseudintermedia TaxID=370111 RepID=UPI00124D3285|nr:hypothetical protein [Brucella pseudintermedia]KAB2679897.1 hypothetical protein F9K78_18435 [Brucella pseudintermedia]
MAVDISIEPQFAELLVNDLDNSTITMEIKATLTFSGTDAPAANDQYSFTFSSKTSGSMKAAPNSSLTQPLLQSQDDSQVYTATSIVVGNGYGGCQISGSKAGDPATWAANAAQIVSVAPDQGDLDMKTMPETALQVSMQVGTPDDGPDRTARIELVAKDLNGKIVPDYDVTFKIDNVRDPLEQKSGEFYDAKKQPVQVRVDEKSGAGFITQKTDSDGKTALYIGTNQWDGYINIHARAFNIERTAGYVYIFSPGPGPDLENPTTDISGDMSDYTQPTFPVTLNNASVASGENVGLFLNGKFEGQTPANKIMSHGGTYTTSAKTSHLKSDTSGSSVKNGLITHRTEKGNLIRSIETQFFISNPPDPAPINPILGPLKQPTGGVININSIHDTNNNPTPFNAIIDLANDKKILEGHYELKANDTIQLQVTLQGDYVATDSFQKKHYTYKKIINSDDLDSNNEIIPIPYADINGYGVPKSSSEKSQYQMFYEIISQMATEPLASCKITSGTLATRQI